MADRTDRPDRSGSPWWAAARTVLAVLVLYLAWVGWDQQRDVAADGTISGPYETWQVVGLGYTVLLVIAYVASTGFPVVAVVAATATLVTAWSIDAMTDTDGDGLWVVGAVLLALGTAAAGSVLAWLVRVAERRRASRELD